MTVIVYGSKNCDTVKKALKWLAENGIAHQLHDYRTDGLPADFLPRASEAFGWEALVNKRSTTWRNLDQAVKNSLDFASAMKVLAEQPTLIKRPIILQEDIALIGFDETTYVKAFKKDSQ